MHKAAGGARGKTSHETLSHGLTGFFDIVGHDGQVISSTKEAAHSLNSLCIFGSIMDLNAVAEICSRRGLRFAQR